MKGEKKYKQLIIEYLEGNISGTDLDRLLDWIDESAGNKEIYFRIKDTWDSKLRMKALRIPVRPLWKASQPVGQRNGKRIFIEVLKYAAVIVLTIGITLMFREDRIVEKETAYHQLSVQNGKQSQVLVLSDGTKVWINASSSLRYPEYFSADQRSVWLDGEAYFEVVGNADQPFIVHTDMIDIRVTGTSFNVTAYKEDDRIITTLVEGSVSLWKDGQQLSGLQQNQQAVFGKKSRRLQLQDVDPSLYVAWKDGYYKIFDTSFEEISHRLEKMYDVKISFTDESLMKIPYSGTFAQEQSLREILEIMCSVKSFRYRIDHDRVYISK